MDVLQALTVITAYENQGRLSGPQRRLLEEARKVARRAAETVRIQYDR